MTAADLFVLGFSGVGQRGAAADRHGASFPRATNAGDQ